MTPFSKICFITAFLALIGVVLGAYTRLSDAGLGCPDWPGCYGKIIPTALPGAINGAPTEIQIDTRKAWTEMIHRYFAGTLGLLVLAIAILAIKNRKVPGQPVVLPLFILCLVIFQALLGMWTVTLLLHPLVVMGHLLGGMTTLGLLWWLALSARVNNSPRPPLRIRGGWGELRKLALLALIILALQIALGGWTSANYAALACPDFPTCLGSWWPKMNWAHAFDLWKNIGVNYGGGTLGHEARVAIQIMHRIGALTTFIVLGWLSIRCISQGPTRQIKTAGLVLLLLLLSQVSLGISTVLLVRPLDVAIAHNAVAALLLLTLITLNHYVRFRGSTD